ncbi:MAG: PD-(D/E)XK nuclease family protein, partial [Ruminiclostridium sp.]|nr:PD-(D/E)XK nuclease family protein [Ruminiclostridium sp.]
SAADLLTVGENAATRRANLDTLLTLAADYGRYACDGILSDFLSYIKDSDRQGCRPEFTANTASKGVQIMSIHASKGLEFPIVFVCDCAKTFNKDDMSKPVLTSDKYGACVCDVNKALMAKIPSFAYKETAAEIDRNLRSEEMRLLYVAATRAKHKLIFTAKQQKRSSSCAECALPDKQSASALIAKNSYFSWLLVPYANDKSLVTGTNEIVVGSIRYRAVYALDDELYCEELTAAESELTDTATQDTASQIAKQITEQYAYKTYTEIAAKYTATNLAALKRRDNGERCELYVARPAFIRDTDSKKLSGKRKGDAYHKLMEHIPFDKPLSETEVKDYILNCTYDFLSDAERECIIPSDISRFFNNDIAKRMLSSERIYREFPIFHRLSDSILSQVIDNYQQTESDGAYVQGIADMFFIENDGIVLIDYKTDSFSDEEKLTEDYSFQLKVYAEALCKAFSMPVKEMYIYSFKRGSMVKI